MSSINIWKLKSLTCALLLAVSTSVSATPNCLRDNKPYNLAGDTIQWSMTIAPGSDCIQGLRWSTMQIYDVSIAEKPKIGKLLLVGPGFRYFANHDFVGQDNFTLIVVGKNRRDRGASTVQITVAQRDAPVAVSAAVTVSDASRPEHSPF